jgi:hypothetical protein
MKAGQKPSDEVTIIPAQPGFVFLQFRPCEWSADCDIEAELERLPIVAWLIQPTDINYYYVTIPITTRGSETAQDPYHLAVMAPDGSVIDCTYNETPRKNIRHWIDEVRDRWARFEAAAEAAE